ncbi:MAG: hypothetical protein P8099_00760 [Gemmatimonadota bacterium]|jgi:hypothetical protein
MKTTRLLPVAVAVVGLAAAGCSQNQPPPPPQPVVQVDTVTVTREVPPPLPQGNPTTICLANGQSVDIRVSAQGDTLIGPQRAKLQDLRPVLGFQGNYAAGTSWFVGDEAIRMNRRQYHKFGTPVAKRCGDLKIVGANNGVNLFADADATAPFSIVYVPVSPGIFQSYQAQVGRVRG